MNKKFIIATCFVIGLLISSFAGAAPAPAGQQLAVVPRTGPTQNHLRVEWHPDDDSAYGEGSLVVFRDGAVIQSIREDVFIPQGYSAYLQMIDLSGDGYEDLLFMHMVNGISQEFHVAYLWVPAKNKFVKSNTLSDRGDIAVLPTPGCVSATTLCHGRRGYISEDFCFNARTGRWKPVKVEIANCP